MRRAYHLIQVDASAIKLPPIHCSIPSKRLSRSSVELSRRRLLDFDMEKCAEHITGHEKWPGNYDA